MTNKLSKIKLRVRKKYRYDAATKNGKRMGRTYAKAFQPF